MFFARWRYAIRIVEKIQSDIKAPLATELVDMIVWGAKNLSMRRQLRKIECVLIAANGICYNSTAAKRLSENLRMDDAAIRSVREKLQRAIKEFADEHNLQKAMEIVEAQPRVIP